MRASWSRWSRPSWPTSRRWRGPRHDAAIYIGNGHAAWEAALANVLSPGDEVLVLATGRFGPMLGPHGANAWALEVKVHRLRQARPDRPGPRGRGAGAPIRGHSDQARCWPCMSTPRPACATTWPALRARARRRGASRAADGRLHRLPRLRPVRDGRLGRRRDGHRQPEGADDAAGPGLRLLQRPRPCRARARPAASPATGTGGRGASPRASTSISTAPRRRTTSTGCATRST